MRRLLLLAPLLALLFALFPALPALAGDALMAMPAGKAYVEECGTCHTAYAPSFLPAASWRRLMDGLERHFGEDASLKDELRRNLSEQLQALALDGPRANRNIAARAGAAWIASTPERVSTSPFFRFMHDEVPASFWQRKKIATQSNCIACHPRADQGRYGEAEVQIPKE